MGSLYASAREIKNAIPVVREVWAFAAPDDLEGDASARHELRGSDRGRDRNLSRRRQRPRSAPDLSLLVEPAPAPMLEPFGFSNPDQLSRRNFAKARRGAASRCLRFLSIGAGNCDNRNPRLASAARSGLRRVHDRMPRPQSRDARARARDGRARGVGKHIVTTEGDFNRWTARRTYDGIIANQSLHHVVIWKGCSPKCDAGSHRARSSSSTT